MTLAALVSGWRYRGVLRRSGLPVIGSGAGFLGGMTGLTGPVVILFYLAGARPVQVIRGNTILFLAALDLLIAASILASGLADPALIWLGALLSMPYLATSLIGQRLFDPAREAVYRWGAYAVIAGAVLRGLPIWG